MNPDNRSNVKCIAYKPNLKASESLLKSIEGKMADEQKVAKIVVCSFSAVKISQVSPP